MSVAKAVEAARVDDAKIAMGIVMAADLLEIDEEDEDSISAAFTFWNFSVIDSMNCDR